MGNRVGRFMAFLVVVVALSVCGAGIALSQTLSLDDQTATMVGDSVTFTLTIDNPSSGSAINALQVGINFDSMVLEYDSHTSGSLGEASYGALLLVSNSEDGLVQVGGLNPVGGVQPGESGEIVQLHFTVASMAGAMLTMTPEAGVASFNVQNGQFTFELPPANNPPLASDDMETTVEGQSVMIDVLANDEDADGEQLTIKGASDGSNGTVAVAVDRMSVTYTPNMGFTGSDQFTYTVTDGTDDAMAMVMVTVTAPPPPANNDPMATDDEAETNEGESVMIDVLVNDTDADEDSLTITDATDGNDGTVNVATDGASVTYTPNADFAGEDQFMYTVSDGEGGMDTATVMVDVMAADGDGDGDGDGDTSGDGGGGGCTLNPSARFDPTLISVLALFMGIHFVRRFTRRQSLR